MKHYSVPMIVMIVLLCVNLPKSGAQIPSSNLNNPQIHSSGRLVQGIPAVKEERWKQRWHTRWIARYQMRIRRREHRLSARSEAASIRTLAASSARKRPSTVISTSPGVFSQTKPDPRRISETLPTRNSPIDAVSDGGRMLLYLLPVLALIIGALQLLRRFRPDLSGQGAPVRNFRSSPVAALGALKLFRPNKAKSSGSGALRLIESLPVGGAGVHLVEVHGRMLLLGATPAGVALLSDLGPEESLQEGQFRALFRAAADGMDQLNMSMEEMPVVALVNELDEALLNTNEEVARRIRRLRTVQETEENL